MTYEPGTNSTIITPELQYKHGDAIHKYARSLLTGPETGGPEAAAVSPSSVDDDCDTLEIIETGNQVRFEIRYCDDYCIKYCINTASMFFIH